MFGRRKFSADRNPVMLWSQCR